MLAQVLAPMSTGTFFEEYWTKRFVHIPGSADKLADFFSWDVLNRTLEQDRFSASRLVLFKAGQKVEPARYLQQERVNANGLTNELANGATLIFNNCEEVHPPLQDLCVELERMFHVYVHVNLYAGWRKDNGFNVHWDDQDNLILQIAGRKHWKAWEPTRAFPFKNDVVDTSSSTKPDGPPVWEGILEPGGVLNMPRGWWHVAYPMDEPCLHLTVTIKNLHGIGMLRWFAHSMKTSEAARMPLPLVASEKQQRAWLDAVWQDLKAAWGPDVLGGYLAHVDEVATPRPAVKLPHVTSASTSVNTDTPLRLARPRPLGFHVDNGSTRLRAHGVDWQMKSHLMPVLQRFNDGQAHTLAELAPGGSAEVALVVKALVMKGVLQRAG